MTNPVIFEAVTNELAKRIVLGFDGNSIDELNKRISSLNLGLTFAERIEMIEGIEKQVILD